MGKNEGLLYLVKVFNMGLGFLVMHIVDDDCREFIVIGRASVSFSGMYVTEDQVKILEKEEYSAMAWNDKMDNLFLHSNTKAYDARVY